jgi:acyl-[acyl-carrier-protein]-phospholipid O-acyltransferase/long-chain-fatty-acid--[acyl-carrier-protein] ligase
MVLRLEPQDKMCCVLPFFHSFGYTCCLWCPALSGFEAAYHANPIDGATVAEMVRTRRLTILLSTPTFLLSYIRRAQREDFATLRAIITGAEKLRKKTADVFEERFGIRPMEGYGATELSPVAAVSVPDVMIDGIRQRGTKDGSIGHSLPGVTMKVVDPDTGAMLETGKEGLLLVKGPNVMLGYLNNPTKNQEVLKNGWYVTGDIALIDKEGFVFLLDRLSRYSKIGGEMVPHLAIEDKYLQGLGATNQLVMVTSAPDEKKGEQIVVFYTTEAGTPDSLHEIITKSDLPNLWKPKKDNYIRVDAMPTLGSGKMDLKRLKSMAEDFAIHRTGGTAEPKE